MPAGIRHIRMTDADWNEIGRLAKAAGLSRAKWIIQACREKAARSGAVIEGTLPHGGNRHIQCANCGGWNVAEVDGVRACADCGWTEQA